MRSEVFEGYEYETLGDMHMYKAFDKDLAAAGYYWTFYMYKSAVIHEETHRNVIQLEEDDVTFFFNIPGKLPEIFRLPEEGISIERKVKFAEKLLARYSMEELANMLSQEEKEHFYGKKATMISHRDLYECVKERF